MTDKLLRGIAAQALNLVKTEMRVAGKWGGFLFGIYHESEGLKRMRSIERMIADALGEDWLDHGRTKDHGYGVLRAACDLFEPDAVAMVSAVNQFEPTDKLRAMGEDAMREMCDAGHDRHLQGVREGLFLLHDALISLAQSPELVCVCTQRLGPNKIHVGAPDMKVISQEDWDGRMKMFGEGEHTVSLPKDVQQALKRAVMRAHRN